MSDNPMNKILDRATVIHLQPDDILVFSNLGDTVEDPDTFKRICGVLGDRRMVGFRGPVELERLRGLTHERPAEGQ